MLEHIQKIFTSLSIRLQERVQGKKMQIFQQCFRNDYYFNFVIFQVLSCKNQRKSGHNTQFVFHFQEDNALKTLRETRKIQKWSQIAKKLEQQFGIKGKNGKRCRERYYNNLSPQLKKDIWTEQQQKELKKLHDEKGNRWAQIAKILGRSDNGVKNHYHSKLRKGIRRINNRISIYFKNQHRPLKYNIISKIVQTAENVYITQNRHEKLIAQSCYEMKNQILDQSEDKDHFTSVQLQNLQQLVIRINLFNRSHKRKVKFNIKNANSKSIDEENSQSDSINLSSAGENQLFSEVQKEYNNNKNFQNRKSSKSKKVLSTNENMKEQLLQTQKNVYQQNNKTYTLRNRVKNSVSKLEQIRAADKEISCKSSQIIDDIKDDCKTPSDIDNYFLTDNGKNFQKNDYEQFPTITWGSQLLNCLMYQNLSDSYNLYIKNENLEEERKIELNKINSIILAANNFNLNIFNSQEIKRSFDQEIGYQSISLKSAFSSQRSCSCRGFVPFRKQQ